MDEDREVENESVHLIVTRWGTACCSEAVVKRTTSDIDYVTCVNCMSYRRHCQHVDFDEWMDGFMECKNCGLQGRTCQICGDVLSQIDDAVCGYHALEA